MVRRRVKGDKLSEKQKTLVETHIGNERDSKANEVEERETGR